MKFKSNLNDLVNFFIFWKNLIKCLVTYVTKYRADAILKTISIKQKIVNFKKLDTRSELLVMINDFPCP